ncbi:MAG: DUF3857 domain-containing protein, partial [Bacteroidota bacterium]
MFIRRVAVLSFIFWSCSLLAFCQPTFKAIPLDLIAGAHTIVRESVSELVVEGPGSTVFTKRSVVTLLNERSKANELLLFYDPMIKIESLSAVLYDQYGNRIEKFKASDFQDISIPSYVNTFDDNRYKYLDCSFNSYPYTIEFEYRVRSTAVIDYDDYLPQEGYGISVMESSYSISHPNDLLVRYKVLNFDPTYEKSISGSTTKHEWQVTNLKPVKREYMDRESIQILPQILVAPTHFEASGYHGDMSTWSSYGKWYRRLNQNRDKLSPALTSTIKSMVKDATSDQEKVAILYRFMQSQVRYVSIQLGIGGWQTFEASYVEENKYGDCKALSNYMKAMLKVVGIEAYEVLVRAGDQKGNLQEDFPQNEFNHVILYVPNQEDGIWLECTSQDYPPNFLGTFTDDRFVLLITPEGGQLKRTPKSTAKDHQRINKVSATLSASGALTATAHFKRTGNTDFIYRHKVSKLKKEEQREWIKESMDLPSFDINSLNIEVRPDSVITNTYLNLNI